MIIMDITNFLAEDKLAFLRVMLKIKKTSVTHITKDMTTVDFYVLMALNVLLADSKGAPVTPTKLINALSMSPQGLSRSFKTLDKGGYITRENSLEDKRSTSLQITEKGKKLISEYRETILDYYQFIIDKMGQERYNQFKDLLTEYLSLTDDAVKMNICKKK